MMPQSIQPNAFMVGSCETEDSACFPAPYFDASFPRKQEFSACPETMDSRICGLLPQQFQFVRRLGQGSLLRGVVQINSPARLFGKEWVTRTLTNLPRSSGEPAKFTILFWVVRPISSLRPFWLLPSTKISNSLPTNAALRCICILR